MRLEGKVAVVTGAMQGIGAGISRVLARNGATVVLTDVSSKVEETAKTIASEGFKAESRVMDVTDPDQVTEVMADIERSHGRVDILVNNAGIYPRRRLVEMDEEFLHRMFEINVFGMFRCARAVLPGMLERRYGKIINMSSVTGPMVGAPGGGQTAYGATKAAVVGFTKALALETAQSGINVNTILPGYIYSPGAFGLRGSSGDEDADEKMREFGYKIPVGRQGSPEDVGNLVLFLASDESSYLTGSEIVIDGGNILQEEYLGPYKPR
ncbi:MAG TPA: SDR family NAD(P)-dependent oxidoreductase [Candidatus Desulfaltia sp.]|nr:SDR family NAD(P)-dependent oxidoreductase [Candidatus Desulfaltia sp.]